MTLNSKAKDYQEQLRRTAQDKRRMAKVSPLGMGKLSTPEMLNEMRAQLNEIRAMLKQYKIGDDMPVKFVVTERDASGKIMSFKVERT